MKPSERVALGKALEELERPKAKERMLAGGPPDESSEGRGETREVVAGALGWSHQTYGRAKKVVEAAEDESLPQEEGFIQQVDAPEKSEKFS